MTSADFRPDVPCATQAIPSLGATAAAPDLSRRASPAAPRLTLSELRAALARRGRRATAGARR